MNKNIIPDPTDNALSGSTHIDRPSWSSPTLDSVDDGNQHPDDNCTWINSPAIDEWTVTVEEGERTFTSTEPARVALTGIRHHTPGLDFTGDRITVTGDLMPGDDGAFGLQLTAPTARRLAAALTLAADVMDGEGEDETPVTREKCDRIPCDHAYRGGQHAVGEHSVNWMRASDLGIEVSANAIEDAPWATRVRMGDAAEVLEQPEVTRLVTALLNAQESATQANIKTQLDTVRLLEADLKDAKEGPR